MDSSTSNLELLPRPLRNAVVVLVIGALAAGAVLVWKGADAMLIILVGATFAGILVGLGIWLRWRQRRRGAPLEPGDYWKQRSATARNQ